ncbi:MAG: hypothetical protein HZC47_03640 [Methanobacterium sp.]|uniref:PsbP-related protein n=1 Tax=Methanobacterium sp. TaxID=2164 RepID=UPI003D64FE66|nr:hypothetical protein [Methanobacterium sp.]
MKKYAFFVIAILALVIFASGCTTGGNNTSTYSGNGVSFNYPGGWQQLQTSSQSTLVSVGDPKSIDNATGSINTLAAIQKAALPSGTTLKQVYDNTYAQFVAQDSTFKTISDTTTTVDGATAYVNIHTVDVKGVQKKEKAVWFEKNGSAYVILCGSLPADFDSQQANFDTIINSFKVQ